MFHNMNMSLSPIDIRNNEKDSDEYEVNNTNAQELSYGVVFKKNASTFEKNYCIGLFD